MRKVSKIREGYDKQPFKFSRWLDGEKDPYLDVIEMQPQSVKTEEKHETEARLLEQKQVREEIYDVENNRAIRGFNIVYKIMCFLCCVVLISVLLITVSNLPPTGEAHKPDNNEVSQRYIEQGLQETGAVNIVTGMILDYRAFDTFGESNVLFIATITVLILLRVDKKKKKEDAKEDDRIYEPKDDVILQMAASILVPVILIFGIYVILNGHISPGGGFSGGAIIGAGLILHLNAFGFGKTERFFTEKTYKWVCFAALSFYCLAKSYSFYTGANHLESHIPLGTPGAILSSGLILPLNICVGLVVACTMYTFYVMFRKGGF
jgi:multicomponent Na+:H+ antiporter subunit B